MDLNELSQPASKLNAVVGDCREHSWRLQRTQPSRNTTIHCMYQPCLPVKHSMHDHGSSTFSLILTEDLVFSLLMTND